MGMAGFPGCDGMQSKARTGEMASPHGSDSCDLHQEVLKDSSTHVSRAGMCST
jgi:hypothetical protein